ncbi:MAG: DUF1553 domain-containing protein [Fuerstiella sp.]|nr:DUF1553 domain-containing protein [Fuerstiella sp.]
MLLLISSGSVPQTAVAVDEPRVNFARDIKPLLSDRCFLCHGPDADTREADLRLDSAEAVFRKLETDDTLFVVAPGKPEVSEVVTRILSSDPDVRMPPPDSGLAMTEREQELVRRWVAEGAEWKGHWAFERIVAPEVPSVDNDDWCQNEIDRFVVAQQQANGYSQNPIASRQTLLRRVTFDLTGLPPTLHELDAFLADQTPTAYEKVVDRLLRSESYGERMAADWLDVARYSDTFGYQVDRDRYVWPWRDWVVRAFNENMPYDRFITEQLAGDLLPNATSDQILATTFNRLHPQKVEGGSTPEEFRVEYVADRTQTVATAFLGLTFECCRCHDHKYDPMAQREYYQLFSFFNNIDEAGLYSYFTSSTPTPTLRLPTVPQEKDLKKTQVRLAAAELALTESNNGLQKDDRRNTSLAKLQAELTVRLEDPTKLIPGQQAALSFETDGVGANRVVKGEHGNAVELTGDHGIDVKVGNFPRWQPFTISTWLKVPRHYERSVVFHRSRAWTDAGSRGYELLIENGHLSAALIHFWPGNAIRIRSAKPLPLNTWMHVAMTYDGSSSAKGLSLWVDGSPATTIVNRDNLYRNITGGGGDTVTIGQRFRDKGFSKGLVDEFHVFDRRLTALEIRQLFDGQSLTQALQSDWSKLDGPHLTALTRYAAATTDVEYQTRLADVQAARKAVCAVQDGMQEIMVMRERAIPRQAYVLTRGAYDARAEEVRSDVPAFLPPMNAAWPKNRLGLAQWLTSREQPLTARVAVNRLWQTAFGNGLVQSPEDFGSQGMAPSHPLLLDWLAADFLQSGWNVKRLLKLLVMSSTYRQSSLTSADQHRRDPENQWLTHAPVFRLNAEMLRDNALAVSGLLHRHPGGAPAKPYELAASFKPSNPDKGSGLYRRSLYTYWKRTAPAPMMMTLDAAKRDVCRVKRERTSSPLQALVVMNGPQFVEAARMLADRLLQKHGNNDQVLLAGMFRLLTSRPPANGEASVLQRLLQDQRTHFRADAEAAAKYVAIGEAESVSKDIANLAAWTTVANVLFVHDECMMRR